MSDAPLEERVAAVERTLTEDHGSEGSPTVSDRNLVDRVEALEEDVANLDAAVQAVRGYVGSVKHVNDEVEERADAAMAKAEALERALAQDVAGGPADPQSQADDCPLCEDGRRGGRPPSEAPGERPERHPHRSDADSNPDPERVPDHGGRPIDHRGDEPGTASAPGTRSDQGVRANGEDDDSSARPADSERERSQPCEADHGRVGHRRLRNPDEPDGLFARLRGVL